MTDLKQRLAALLASPKGKAMIEEGQRFSIEEELQAADAQVLAECTHQKAVIEAAMKTLIGRKAN